MLRYTATDLWIKPILHRN